MKLYIFLFIFLFSGIGSVFSQRILVVDKARNPSKRIKYHSGDYIVVKIKNDKTKYKGFIEVVSDTSFFVSNNLIMLDSLHSIIKYNKAPKAISLQAFVVGGIITIASAINNGVTKGAVFPGDNSYIVPAAFLGLGVIFLPFWRKTIKINNRTRFVKILDMTPMYPIQESP
jgi:hypothetical protein